jgi:predicted ATP-grasp superfamily ATP-dependent carboligase|tara:strand:+ start:457 stop:1491 length:1035 start_codon:yes stop_codon:yes gene_type:complete
MNKTKLIVTPHSELWLQLFVPKHWDYIVLDIKSFESKSNDFLDQYDIFYLSDVGYDSVSKIINQPSDGSCFQLSVLCNNKYKARTEMLTLQDIPFVLCDTSYIEWYNTNDKLIAKPVTGSGSRDLHIVHHGDYINNPEKEVFIVEKYIDDNYPRISVDGYICGNNIGILSIWDNVYDENNKTQLTGLSFPSIHSQNPDILNKYISVVKELKEKTNCNNQIIDIEFFIIGENDIRVIEINPRCGGNYLPIYKVTGYLPLLVSEQLKNNIVPEKTEKLGKGYTRYNYEVNNVSNYLQPEILQNNIYSFSVESDTYSHSFAYSYDEDIHMKDLQIASQNEYDKLINK